MFPLVQEAFAQEAAGAAGVAANPFFQLIPFVLIFVVFFFLIIRPQQKKHKAHQEMLTSLKKGDRIVTTGGIYGTIQKIHENVLTVEIAEKTRIQLERAQVAYLAKDQNAHAKDSKETKEENAKEAKESAETTSSH